MRFQETRQSYINVHSGPSTGRGRLIIPVLCLLLILVLSTTAVAVCLYQDADGDGYGNPAAQWCGRWSSRPSGYIFNNTDCDDTNAAIHLNALEMCDGSDNDCDGNTDEGCVTWYQDSDNDTYGNAGVAIVAVAQPSGYVLDNTDCDDNDGGVHPGAAETCDGIDNNCLNGIDEGCLTWYRDLDGDSYGNPAVTKRDFSQPVGYVAGNDDCDDSNAAVYPGATEVCDGNDNDCDGSVDEGCQPWYRDSDSDTYGDPAVSITAISQPAGYVSNSTDCDDDDVAVHPGTAEICDTVDNDCDGSVDEGCQTWYRDSDHDLYGDPAVSTIALTAPAGFVASDTDCDDTDYFVNPGIPENPSDGIDNNCNGQVDEGTTWYEDSDGDGYGNPAVSVTGAQPAGYVGDGTDCDDNNAAINPGATELCEDGINNDCDSFVDEGCVPWYQDSDGDGYGNAAVSIEAAGQPAGYVSDNTDCNDTNAAIYPTATEVCGDGLDNNCAGGVDEGCVTWFQDDDGDSYGDAGVSTVAIIQPAGFVANSSDCDDTDAAVNPGMPEVCDGVDNNCNTAVDEGCVVKWYQDLDGDNFGNPFVFVIGTQQPGYVPIPGDCDDTNPAINPDAPEICDDGLDNNCAGGIDEGCLDWHQDLDGDGFGNSAASVKAAAQPGGYVFDGTDCNDGDAAVHPGAVEICDGMDSNCDGVVDEGCNTWYADSDNDGYGYAGISTVATVKPVGYADNSTDCDDSDATVNPGATEICEDTIDNDCDGSVDEGCQAWYRDSDGDGYGDSAVSMITAEQPLGYVDRSGDCDDGNADVNPSMPEICGDTLDNNCSGGMDEGCMIWYQDNDNDSYGSSVSANSIGKPVGYVARTGDCNDSNAAVNPSAVEACDGVDNDCDGITDEGCVPWYRDADGDNYGNTAVSQMAVIQPVGFVADAGDCDDTDVTVNPGATELCGDSTDNDCDGIVDEGCVLWYRDADGDSYGDPGVVVNAVIQPTGYVNDDSDCDDTDAAVNPGVPEVCADGIDNNCSGSADEGCLVWYRDNDGDNYGDAGVSIVSMTQPAGYVNDSMDCDDTDLLIHPGAAEVCDGINDENCDGIVDEGCVLWYQDSDGDNYGDSAVSVVSITQPGGFVSDNTDCDDTAAEVNPGATEVCGDGLDNNCAGGVDEGCVLWYQDNDGDTYGDPAVSTRSIVAPVGYVSRDGDCDDTNGAIHPGAAEICGDSLDNNCAGGVDEGCLLWYQDNDDDNYGNAAVSILAAFPPAGYVSDNTDCDDTRAVVNPSAAEVCGDGLDNNCAGGVDEGCVLWYQDNDGDNYGDAAVSLAAAVQPPGYVADSSDCDDTNPSIHPGAAEVCDGIDNNCSGSKDETCKDCYQDLDGDGYGDPGVSSAGPCGGPGISVPEAGDCDDTDAAINPGIVEACGDGIDNDCDGAVDEGCRTWFQDGDGDNYGDAAVSLVALFPPAGFASDNTDCDDTRALVHPGAEEVCDGVNDEDCDGAVDEGCRTWYQDNDADNYGDPAVSMMAAIQPSGYVSDGTDCDDANVAVNPGSAEVCADGLDNNCNGAADENCMIWYRDNDSDNFGDLTVSTQAIIKPAGFVSDNTDCDDTRAFVNPGASEICDGIDNNCAGGVDEGCVPWYRDNDGDRYGSVISTVSISQPTGCVALSGDCDDTNASINPEALEACDGIDNDCDGSLDERCMTWYPDGDGDTYGDTAMPVVAPVQPVGHVSLPGDCDDANLAINPGATEICDGLDNDCDGSVDEGCAGWYQDLDGDTYGDPAAVTMAVVQPAGFVARGGDCNDSDVAVNPAAVEVCDSIDNDCDGSVDEGCAGWYQDLDGDFYGDEAVSTVSIDQPIGFVPGFGDCDDSEAAVNPGATEICGDGIDNDCDGVFDEGCVTWYQDYDGDGYGVAAASIEAVIRPAGFADNANDCDDNDATINPGEAEICGDGVDNDCDGFSDEGCISWYQDNDGDGFGSVITLGDSIQPAGYVSVSGDCNDSNALVNPGMAEACDGLDNDCDGIIDEDCILWYQDLDGDHFGNTAVSQRSFAQPPGYVAANGDCNDDNPAIRPFVLDYCDHLDNDCDFEQDEDVPSADIQKYYLDNDGDDYGNPNTWIEDCMQPAYNYVLVAGDCNDNDAAIHPVAFDICGNGIDEDCSAGGDPSGDRPCGTTTQRGCADISDIPLEIQVDSAPPIVMLLLDNSGSMAWDVMCPGEADGLFKGYSDATTGHNEYWEAQYSGVNTIYYNPAVTYTPWPNYPNADTQRPRRHPNGSPTTDLDSKFETFSGSGGIDVKVAHYYAWSSSEQRPYLVFINNTSVTYYRISPPASGELDANHVSGPVAESTVPDDAIIPQAWEDGNRVCSAAEAAVARQNFANWYQYYRTRMLTANNTLAKVVSNVSGIQIGVTTINVNSASGFFSPVLVDDNIDTVSGHDGPANRQAVIDFIFEAGVPNGSTPLRNTFKSLGNFFDDTAHDSRPSPWASAEDGGECQMAFIIMMTDGYYNGANPNIGDTDGDHNTDFDGPPFGDTYGEGNTLADLAMNYYERDLAPGLDNNVPTTATDTARHQHVVTYSISFGVIGTLDPKAYSFNLDSPGCSSGAVCTATAPCNCVPFWPYVPNTNEGCPEKIDDLYHAAVNARGKYFATSNVQQLSYALSTILNEISDRRGSGASVAVSSQELTEDTMLYRGFYNTSGWSGELGAWRINPIDGSVSDTPTWLASKLLDNRGLASNPRHIFTYNPDSAHGVLFDLVNLSTEQKKWLGDTDSARQRLIDFLKGDRSEEKHNGGYLRDRNSLLGDIVHSAPVHVIYGSGQEFLFVGGNDGMLHAFDARSTGNGGQEVFAYIPSFVYEKLTHLSDPDYNHKYYVDTTPYIDSSRLLIGGLGAGGKGYFALDVTDPGTFSSSDVLWEYPPGIDDDMGFSFPRPIVVPHQSGRLAIFGNGYDSKNGHAVLYVLRLDANNEIVEVKKIDTLAGSQSGDPEVTTGCNGLSSTLATDVNYDNKLDYIYAGDLQGNLWKFDLTADTSDDWQVYYGTSASPQPLFKAEYAGVPQPIYAKPGAMVHCLPNRSGYILVFGTGQFFAHGDYQDTSQQTIYGIWDWAPELEDGGIADPEQYPLGKPTRMTDYASIPVALGGPSPVTFGLLGQSVGSGSGLFSSTSANRLHDRYIDPDGVPNNGDDQRAWFDADAWQVTGAAYTGVRYLGWYLDLPNTGERVVADTTIRAGLAIMVSLDPSPSPCTPGGNSILQLLQACDGSQPIEEVLDTNGDHIITGEDQEYNRKELDDIYYKPVIIENKMYFNEKEPEAGPSEHLGVTYWRRLIVP